MQNSEANALYSNQQFQRWTALTSIALIAVTWRLWTPQTVFPQVPALEILRSAPGWLDWVAIGGVVLSLIAIAILSQTPWVAIACGLLLSCLLVLFSLDQHRFQPWAYELALFAIVWATYRDDRRLQCMRWLLISIYAYSALGKLDFEFLHTVGQQMLSVVLSSVGVEASRLPDTVRLIIVATFPLAELAVAVGLALGTKWRRVQRISGCIAILLHIGLIVVLGPFGLNHRLGVLVWNAQVAIQAYWLFVAKQRAAPSPGSLLWPLHWRERFGFGVIVAAMILPTTERSGFWDHWPSWALYAPHSSRVKIEVTAAAVKKLPESLRPLVAEPMLDENQIAVWRDVPIGVWSLATLDTPIYPQARFQLGVAERIAADVDSDFQLRVTVLGTASRWSGLRREESFTSRQQLLNASKRYWLNSLPRMAIR